MRKIQVEGLSFGAIFLSLSAILVYLALTLESAKGEGFLALPSQGAAELVSFSAMKGLLLSCILGLGLDGYMKKDV